MTPGRVRAIYRPGMPRLANTTIVVTGGASGLGRAMCVAFAAEGARVVVGDVSREPLHVGGVPTEQLIAEAGGVARFVTADVSRADDIDALVDAALELGDGRLDVMVNNAMVAGPHSKGLLETSEADWDVIFDVGLRGTFLGCRRAVRQMLTQEPRDGVRGRLINMSSEQGMVGAPGHVAYSAMKGGVVNLTRQVAVDFAEHGIVCNAIAPGKIVTPRESSADPELKDDLVRAHAHAVAALRRARGRRRAGRLPGLGRVPLHDGHERAHRRRLHGVLATVRDMPRLQDRSIIVTGGASGIGRSLCIGLAAEGARVIVGDLRRDQLYVERRARPIR